MKYILLTEKAWHKSLFEQLKNEINADWLLIDRKENFSLEALSAFSPNKIFIPHWSYIIPTEIYGTFECILFHMTDLPFGRGGSPLQNLIERGYEDTKITAFRVVKELDAGPIYLKRNLSLHGTAKEILHRSTEIIQEMIFKIHNLQLSPVAQSGDVVIFKRRNPDQSDISKLPELKKIYDYIRMLDCEGYPPAFIDTLNFRFEFTQAVFENSETLLANVRITKK